MPLASPHSGLAFPARNGGGAMQELARDEAAAMFESHPLADGQWPRWASGVGEDRFGVFAEFTVNDVVHRMRWIPGGRGVVGSPPNEPGRYENEERREIELDGFWLGEVPCTQDLYAAVTGENPSRFVHPRRPVEQVSWHEAVTMLQRLNAMIPGLEVRLPFEAEWEFACRGGTETATYAGSLAILGVNNAPALDPIAWYGGNSGVGFDLAEGYDSSDWEERQYPHVRAGTRIVGLKRANPFGLYDTLGNVYEWCTDVYGGRMEVPDRQAQEMAVAGTERADPGSHRVLRGGGWGWRTRRCRAAARHALDPGYRFDGVGFRLSRGQGV